MPLQLIESDLVSGTLVRLAMPDHPGGTYRFAGIWRRDRPPGPAASWLLDQFVELGRNDVEEQGLATSDGKRRLMSDREPEDRKSTRLNSRHSCASSRPSVAG